MRACGECKVRWSCKEKRIAVPTSNNIGDCFSCKHLDKAIDDTHCKSCRNVRPRTKNTVCNWIKEDEA